MKLTQGQIYALAIAVGMKQPRVMAAIAMAESGGNTGAHNATPPDNSYGLWQINMLGDMGPSRRKQFGISSNQQLYNPLVNALAAKKIQASQGLSAWSTYTNGAYKKHMSENVSSAPTTASQAVADKVIDWRDPFDLWPDDAGEPPKGFLDEFFGDEDSDLIDPTPDILGGLPEALAKTADFLVNPRSWLRIGYGVLGAVLVAGGLFLMVRNTAVSQTVGKVTSAVKKGSK